MISPIWKKISLSIGVLLLTTVSVAQEFTIEVITGAIVIEKDYAWMCLPPSRAGVMCVKVHKSSFCPTEIAPPGVLKCSRPMMAEDKQEWEL